MTYDAEWWLTVVLTIGLVAGAFWWEEGRNP